MKRVAALIASVPRLGPVFSLPTRAQEVPPFPRTPATATLKVNRRVVAQATVPVTAPLLFIANDCLDAGTGLGSLDSLEYYDKTPFAFNGKIERVQVKYGNDVVAR